MSFQFNPLDAALIAGLLPALLLFRQYKRLFGRAQDFVINISAGFGAMFPVALTKFEATEEPLGLYAVAYFLVYFSGLLVFNWRQSKIAHGRHLG